MGDEEDWDAEIAAPAPTPSNDSPPQQDSSTPTTPHQTLKITDGYKYSYEALASPANIDDWVEPPSYGGYGGSRRNGYSQSPGPIRNERFNDNKR